MDRELFSVVGRIHPEAWDAIIPRYVVAGHRRFGDEVALNPQPLPPRAFSAGADLLAAVLHRAIIIQGGRDASPVDTFLADIEDWCGTGWPRWFPKPPPPPWGWEDRDLFLGAALQAAALAGRFDHHPDLQEGLRSAADRLAAQG